MQHERARSTESRSSTAPARTALLAAAILAAGCGAPVLTRDGKLVFAEGGAKGASVITANGVEFLDSTDIPQPVVRRSVDEPWRPATGFLLPRDGIFRKTSTPVPAQGPGLAVVLRASDVLVPSWGGELLVRLDALAPAAAFEHAQPSVRAPEKIAIVIDGPRKDTSALVGALLENLGDADRVGIVDAGSGRPLLPMIHGSHRTLLQAAVDRLVGQASRGPTRNLAGALALARGWVGLAPNESAWSHHVLVVTDGVGVAQGGEALAREAQALAKAGTSLIGVGADRLGKDALTPLGEHTRSVGSLAERQEFVAAAVAPPGDVVLNDVELAIASVPAPSHVIEVSGGQSALTFDADRLYLGDLYAGEARTEVARIAVPPWVPGEPLEITVTATYKDAASGEALRAETTLRCRYSAEVEEIANNRHGDVIAYASALAMVRRLHRAFLGSAPDRVGDLRPTIMLQARSLAEMAKSQGDPAIGAQAEILTTLLGVLDD